MLLLEVIFMSWTLYSKIEYIMIEYIGDDALSLPEHNSYTCTDFD